MSSSLHVLAFLDIRYISRLTVTSTLLIELEIRDQSSQFYEHQIRFDAHHPDPCPMPRCRPALGRMRPRTSQLSNSDEVMMISCSPLAWPVNHTRATKALTEEILKVGEMNGLWEQVSGLWLYMLTALAPSDITQFFFKTSSFGLPLHDNTSKA